MSSAGYKYRLMLRDLSMLLPYLLCIKLLIEHMEMLHSIYNNMWIATNNSAILDTHISWAISNYVSYDWLVFICLYLLSYSFEYCWKHQLAIYYLGLNLIQKKIIESMAMGNTALYYYCIINIIIISSIIFIGIRQEARNKTKKHDTTGSITDTRP